MTKQGHVGTIELFVTMSIYQSITIFLNLPNVLAKQATTGAWLLNLLQGVFAFLLFIPVYLVIRRFPGESIVQIARDLLGRPGGVLVSFFLAGFYLYQLAIYSRSMSDAIISTILPTTPLPAVLILALLSAVVVSYLGLEALTRTALIFSPFILFGIGFIIVLALPEASWHGIYPILGVPLTQLALSAGQLAPVVQQTFFLALLAPYWRQGKGFLGLVFWSTGLVTLMTTILVVVLEINFIFPSIKSIPYPLYQLVKTVHIGRFMQRMEALFVIMSAVANLIYLSSTLHFGILALGQGLQLKDWRPLIFPAVVIAYALAFLPDTSSQIVKWYYSLPSALVSLSIILFLPLMLYIVAVLKGKKGGTGREAQTD